MRALIQRVSSASVSVDGESLGSIATGFVVLLGVSEGDSIENARYLVDKTLNLRVFPDDAGRFDRSLLDIDGELLVVSQFTLYGDVQKGKRPSWMAAARPDQAEPLIEQVVEGLTQRGIMVETGRFRADMKVKILNDGPVTLMVEV